MLSMFDPELNRIINGTRVVVAAGNGQFAKEVIPGYSFLCSNDYRIHIGLGQNKKVDKATVYWPGGFSEEFVDIAANQHLRLEKGTGTPVDK
jgi:hypothetical protein